MSELTANRPKTRDRVPKLVPVGLEKKIIKASCPERLGGAHNLLEGHLGRGNGLSVRRKATTNILPRTWKRTMVYVLVRVVQTEWVYEPQCQKESDN
jgi:hypothetical protein